MRPLVEESLRLDVHALQRGGALVDGAVTFWGWGSGEGGSLACEQGRLHWQGRRKSTIKFDWKTCNAGHGEFVRPHLHCPQCRRGCYHLYYYTDAFKCRVCAGLGYRDQQLANNVRCYTCSRISILRKKLGVSPVYFTPLPRHRTKYVRPYTDRLRAELKAAEAKVKRMAREVRHGRS